MAEQYASCPAGLLKEVKFGRTTLTDKRGRSTSRGMHFMPIDSCRSCGYHATILPEDAGIICAYVGSDRNPRKTYSSDEITFISPERMQIGKPSPEELERHRQKVVQDRATRRGLQEENASALGIDESSLKEIRDAFKEIEKQKYPHSTSDQ